MLLSPLGMALHLNKDESNLPKDINFVPYLVEIGHVFLAQLDKKLKILLPHCLFLMTSTNGLLQNVKRLKYNFEAHKTYLILFNVFGY